MTITEKLARDAVDSIWPQKLLPEIGFTPEQQAQIAAYLEAHDMTEQRFLYLAAMHYYDRCAEMDEQMAAHPPAYTAGVAPKWCADETNFKPEVL